MRQRENPHPVIGLGVRRRQEKGRLGKVQPAGDALHLFSRQAFRISDDRERIAGEGIGAEHVDELEGRVMRISSRVSMW